MEDNQEKLLEEIAKDVRSNAELVEDMVNKENDALRNDQVSFYKDGILKETSAYLEGELKDVRMYAATKSSHDKLETKKKLLELRGNFVKELKNDVTEELKKFAKSDAYKDYLLTNLKKIENKDNGYFVVRENDMQLMQELCQKVILLLADSNLLMKLVVTNIAARLMKSVRNSSHGSVTILVLK